MFCQLEEAFDKVRVPYYLLSHLGLLQSPAVKDLSESDFPKKTSDYGYVDRLVYRLDAFSQYFPYEQMWKAPNASVFSSKARVLPLADVDSNTVQRHLDLEHFRMTADAGCFFAAVLPEETPQHANTVENPFRQLSKVFQRSDSSGSFVYHQGEAVAFESEEGTALTWDERALTQIALQEADPNSRRMTLFRVQKWKPHMLKQDR